MNDISKSKDAGSRALPESKLARGLAPLPILADDDVFDRMLKAMVADLMGDVGAGIRRPRGHRRDRR